MLRTLAYRFVLCAAALFLVACGGQPLLLGEKVDQSGALKVHPGLLGQPVPPELQQKDEPAGKMAAAGTSTGAPFAPTGAAARSSETEVHFDFKDASIKPNYDAMLQTHAQRLSQNPKTRLRLEGHADERGAEGLNKRLGWQRGESVKEALTARGASAKQIRVISLGETKPKVQGHDEESWAENRRVEIIYEKEE